MNVHPFIHAVKTGCRQWNLAWLPKLALIVLIQGMTAEAELVAPYQPDEHTLHLWHLNEPVPPIADAVSNGLDLLALENGANLGNESYVGPKSFGTALGTYVGNPALPPGCAAQSAGLSAQSFQHGRGDNVPVRYAGSANAFTYEAIVRIDFDPTTNYGDEGWGRGQSPFMQVIAGDADEDDDRVFQFRLSPIGTLNGNEQPLLEFINLNRGNEIQSLTAAIPTNGPDAIRTGNWYHLAVSYDGQTDQFDNLRFYWTRVEPERTAANPIGSGQMTHSLPADCQPDFAIGQTGRQSPAMPAPNHNFVGLIDEVRISGVARSPRQMLFGEAALVDFPELGETNSAPALAAMASPTPLDDDATHKPALEPVTLMNGAVARGPTNQPRLALLFSCRESDASAFATVEALKVHQAKASFFLTRDFLRPAANRLLVQSLMVQGHYVGLQSDPWTQLADTDSAAAPEVADPLPPKIAAHLKQLAAFGLNPKDVRFFLPTSEQLNPATAERASAWELNMIAGTPGTLSFATATVDGTKDFVSSEAIFESILQAERGDGGLNGFLLLFPLDSGARQTDKFSARFGELIDTLRQRGYEFVRVDQLLNESVPRRTAQPTLVNLNHP